MLLKSPFFSPVTLPPPAAMTRRQNLKLEMGYLVSHPPTPSLTLCIRTWCGGGLAGGWRAGKAWTGAPGCALKPVVRKTPSPPLHLLGAAPSGRIPGPVQHSLSPSLSLGYYGNKGVIDVG